MAKNIKTEEVYKDYSPPFDVCNIVDRLIKGIPQEYLNGLDSVIITNASGLNRQARRKRKKQSGKMIQTIKSLGRYHGPWRGQPAYIELFVDNIFPPKIKLSEIIEDDDSKLEKIIFRIFPLIESITNFIVKCFFLTKLLRDFKVSKTLYHEIGHHIHRTRVPEYKEPEDVANIWGYRLMRHYFYRKYWYQFPFVWILLTLHRYAMETLKGIKFS
ncbi:MAG: hypothetical protein GY749_29775 [Desulfobacteraceae bacterium]|nr:hypothetical protein [Desulfobacteraceae bacterium]